KKKDGRARVLQASPFVVPQSQTNNKLQQTFQRCNCRPTAQCGTSILTVPPRRHELWRSNEASLPILLAHLTSVRNSAAIHPHTRICIYKRKHGAHSVANIMHAAARLGKHYTTKTQNTWSTQVAPSLA
ncbi:hypothetical protein DQ04_07831050, partial [Trypanosoma grayi]|uniref:hypothetical protein n=1 Tax=Trypanosoma grayi TaxID=71804 RepID=UPI0004F47313